MKRLFEEWGLACVFAADGAKAWELLRDQDIPTLALIDWILPKLDGVALCRKIRCETGSRRYIYTIFITAKNRKQDVVNAIEAGADDYLTKPFYAPELKARVLAGERILNLQTALLQTQDSLRLAATHDTLTGLKNRMEIVGALERELARAQRSGGPVSIMFVDIDHFKAVNDTLGHLAGDFVLKEVSRRLAANVRSYDHVGRYGGEEFLLVLPGCDFDNLRKRAAKVLQSINRDPFETPQGPRKLTVSIGIACQDGRQVSNTEQLIHRTDLALYRAKKQGRNRVEAANKQVQLSARIGQVSMR